MSQANLAQGSGSSWHFVTWRRPPVYARSALVDFVGAPRDQPVPNGSARWQVYRTHSSSAAFVHVTLDCGLPHVQRCKLSALIRPAEAMTFQRCSAVLLIDSQQLGTMHAVSLMWGDAVDTGEGFLLSNMSTLLGTRGRRKLQLKSAPPPYGRLTGCDHDGYLELTLGVVIDYGFVVAAGGADAALALVTETVGIANALLEDQVRVYYTLVIQYLSDTLIEDQVRAYIFCAFSVSQMKKGAVAYMSQHRLFHTFLLLMYIGWCQPLRDARCAEHGSQRGRFRTLWPKRCTHRRPWHSFMRPLPRCHH